jgi:uncharacterized protein (TIGR02246 family)
MGYEFSWGEQMTDESDQQQIKEVLTGIVAAAQAGDPDAYITFVTEDAVMMWEGQPAVIGHKAIHEFMSGFSGDTSFDFQGQTDEIQVVGDWALHRHSGVATMAPAYGGEATQLDRKYIDILRRVNEEWKISHHIYNLNVPSSPD